MIVGHVTAYLEAIVRLKVQGPAGQEDDIDAVIDTGFDGWPTLPPALIAQLGLVWDRRGRAMLGDGTDCYIRRIQRGGPMGRSATSDLRR